MRLDAGSVFEYYYLLSDQRFYSNCSLYLILIETSNGNEIRKYKKFYVNICIVSFIDLFDFVSICNPKTKVVWVAQ